MTSRVVTPRPATSPALPDWRRVLAVVAHPDDESFGLGAVLHAFAAQGADVAILCLTHGESSAHGGTSDLGTIRSEELQSAARALGATRATLLHHPDGALSVVRRHLLADDVIDEIGVTRPDGLVVFDSSGVTGHPDHAAATSATLLAAAVLELPVLAWTLPQSLAAQLNEELGTSFSGTSPEGIQLEVVVHRDRQLAACREHRTQAVPSSPLWRRLEMQGDIERLRWLRRPTTVSAAVPPVPRALPANEKIAQTRHLGHDRFEVLIRGHTINVDQPAALGGDDTAPTPTELFVASLAACVAFYARRYLARHGLPTDGFGVEVEYELGEHPSRVAAADIRIHLPSDFPEDRREPLLAVAAHCTVHNTLTQLADVSMSLAPPVS
ncbi:MAG: PIG-L family deacetylase [Nocardioidaceae bacterium]